MSRHLQGDSGEEKAEAGGSRVYKLMEVMGKLSAGLVFPHPC